MLELRGLSRHFGGVRAVDGVDLTIPRGEVVGLIGPNGSGKTTTVNLITGLFPPTTGQIIFEGEDLTAWPIYRRVTRGIGRTFQNIRLFGRLTVWQNLWVAQNSPADRAKSGLFSRWVGGSSGVRERLSDLLELTALKHRQNELAANLSFGEQRRLEMARALATRPKLLLLDEPAAGMNGDEIRQLDDQIRLLKREGYTILLIEHHMELVMAVADRIAVLNFGQKIAEGSPAAVQADPAVRKAYLGGDDE